MSWLSAPFQKFIVFNMKNMFEINILCFCRKQNEVFPQASSTD